MRTDVIVGVDFGSSRIKVAAYDGEGRPVASAESPTPKRSGTEGDGFLVLAMIDAAIDLVRSLALPPGSIAAVGLSSMGEAGTLIDHSGALVDLAFPTWYDPRGADVIARIEDTFGSDDLTVRTGHHTHVASTLAKLGHVAAQTDSPLEGSFVGLCAALAWRLTGEITQEAGLAVTSGVYDSARGEYLDDVWAAAGLGGVALPRVAPAGFGHPARTRLAKELGLAEGAPVVIAGHDHPVAAVGAGMRANEVGDSMGTGEALIAVMRSDLARDDGHCARVLRSDPDLTFEVWPATGERLVVWERMRPGLAMQAFLDHSGLDRNTVDRAAPPPHPVDRVEHATARILELGGSADLPPTPDSWAAIIDHYVLVANEGQKALRDATGADGITLLTGGGLRSERWRRSKALLATPPLAVPTVRETATRGAAAITGATIGWWPDAESMPGAQRIDLRPGSLGDMDRAVGGIFS
ncbi:FGGY family carbohydrate kinase [Amnibacterium flavum]|nr:FGGY family carbohydrate kinase [Amnibacterium flavum]